MIVSTSSICALAFKNFWSKSLKVCALRNVSDYLWLHWQLICTWQTRRLAVRSSHQNYELSYTFLGKTRLLSVMACITRSTPLNIKILISKRFSILKLRGNIFIIVCSGQTVAWKQEKNCWIQRIEHSLDWWARWWCTVGVVVGPWVIHPLS